MADVDNQDKLTEDIFQASISDAELFTIATDLAGASLEVLYLNNDITNIRKARQLLRPSMRWGTSLKPSSTMLIEFPGPKNGRFDLICTDSKGIVRNKTHYANDSIKPRFRVAFLGGSTIMGTGSRKPEWTIPAQVEKELRSRNIAVDCINFGVAGMTSRDSLAQLIDVVLPLKPDLVVFYTGWNCAFNFHLNAYLNSSDAFASDAIHPGLGSRQVELMQLLSKSFDLSASVPRLLWLLGNKLTTKLKEFSSSAWLHSAIHNLRGIDPTLNNNIWSDWIRAISGEQVAFLQDAASQYLRIMNTAAAICAEEDVAFLGFFQPNLFWGAKHLTNDEKRFIASEPVDPDSQLGFYKAVMEQDTEKKIIDLSQTFSDERRQIYIDTGHMNPLGNYIMAKTIARHLKKSLEF